MWCCLSLIVSGAVTRGSLNQNQMVQMKTVFNTRAPKMCIHVHVENNQQCDQVQQRPHSLLLVFKTEGFNKAWTDAIYYGLLANR